jgi:hypothetical protein
MSENPTNATAAIEGAALFVVFYKGRLLLEQSMNIRWECAWFKGSCCSEKPFSTEYISKRLLFNNGAGRRFPRGNMDGDAPAELNGPRVIKGL